MTCRDEVLAALRRLEARHNRSVFGLAEIVTEVLASTSDFTEGTIRTHVSSRMCAQAPDHHGTIYDDLERVRRGEHRRRIT